MSAYQRMVEMCHRANFGEPLVPEHLRDAISGSDGSYSSPNYNGLPPRDPKRRGMTDEELARLQKNNNTALLKILTTPSGSLYRSELWDYIYGSIQRGQQDYITFAHVGHGVNSYHYTYCLHTSAIRIFWQLDYGGAYSDAVADAKQIRETFEACRDLDAKVVSMISRGEWHPARRMLVAYLLDEGGFFVDWYVPDVPEIPKPTGGAEIFLKAKEYL